MLAGFTIPMARALLAEGRLREVERMLQPLVDTTAVAARLARHDVLVRCMLARIHLLEDRDLTSATTLLRSLPTRDALDLLGIEVRAEVSLWRGWCDLLSEDPERRGSAALDLRLAAIDGIRTSDGETILWAHTGLARQLASIGKDACAAWFARSARRLQRVVQSAPVTPWLSSIPVTVEVEEAGLPAEYIWTGEAAEQAGEIMDLALSTSLPLFVWGESGSGRTHFARCMHDLDLEEGRRFELIQSAVSSQDASIERATQAVRGRHPLTLCLHDVETHSLATQRAVDALVQEATQQGVTLRLVVTSTRDFDALVRSGRVHRRLLEACSYLQVHLPPLRKRPGDIPLLVRHFLRTLPRQQSLPAAVTDGALTLLIRYPWPGNVRQLRNEVERALIHVRSEPAPVVDAPSLSAAIRKTSGNGIGVGSEGELDRILAETEREVIASVLDQTGGQVAASAEVLGLSRQGLYKKMKRLGLDAAGFQREAGGSVRIVQHAASVRHV